MNRTRWLAIAGAGLAAVVGGGAAIAATGSSDPRSDFLGDVAKRLGVTQDKLEDAIQGASIDRIDAAVARGDLTKEQGEELKKHLRSGDGPMILPGFPGKDLHERGFDGPRLGIGPPGPFPGFDFLDEAADYLGMDAADVRAALRDGKTLADLAKDRGKSVDGLEQHLRDSIRDRLDKAVDKGALTKQQADRMAERLGGAVDKLVEGGRFEFHFRARPGDLPKPGAARHAPFAPA